MQTISVLGCGWLGLPLARRLVATGWRVKGSTTTPSKISVLENSNIIPYHLTCQPSVEGENVADFFRSDVLFVNIPFRRNLSDPRFYQAQIASVIPHAVQGHVRHVIFASSTVVYPPLRQMATEEDVIHQASERAQTLLDTETLLLKDKRFLTTVIRFAGLYGPGREIAGLHKSSVIPADPEAPVNLIHLQDCLGIIEGVIAKKAAGIFNACSDDHPKRCDLYTAAAKAAERPAPVFKSDAAEGYKIISNAKLKRVLGYSFTYPSPLDWIKTQCHE